MAVRTAPDTRPAPGRADDNLTHVTCCLPDDPGEVSLCGVDVSESEWRPEGPDDCVVCLDLERGDTCPILGRCSA